LITRLNSLRSSFIEISSFVSIFSFTFFFAVLIFEKLRTALKYGLYKHSSADGLKNGLNCSMFFTSFRPSGLIFGKIFSKSYISLYSNFFMYPIAKPSDINFMSLSFGVPITSKIEFRRSPSVFGSPSSSQMTPFGERGKQRSA
jgi:hypothetical protein